jgi:hypothetical protein
MPTLAVGMSETRENYDMPTASMGMAPHNQGGDWIPRKLLDSAANRGLMYVATRSARVAAVLGKKDARKEKGISWALRTGDAGRLP